MDFITAGTPQVYVLVHDKSGYSSKTFIVRRTGQCDAEVVL